MLERLTAVCGDAQAAEQRLLSLLRDIRSMPGEAAAGRAAGNLINLLRLLRRDLSQDGRLAVSGGADGTVKVWDTPSGQQLAIMHGHCAAVRGVALSRDAQVVASGNEDGTIRLWESLSGRLLATLQGHSGGVTSVALSPDGRIVARGGVDGAVKLWDVPSGQLLASLSGHTAGVGVVVLHNDAHLLVSGNADGTIKVWASTTGRLLATLPAHADAVRAAAMSGDGRVLASASLDGTVRLWEVGSWRLLKSLDAQAVGVRGVALSYDGQCLVSGSVDGTLSVWDVCTGRLLRNLPRHPVGTGAIAMDRVARLVASAGGSGELRLSEVGTGRLLAALHPDMARMHDVALSETGRWWPVQARAGPCASGTPAPGNFDKHSTGVTPACGAWRSRMTAACWPAAALTGASGSGTPAPAPVCAPCAPTATLEVFSKKSGIAVEMLAYPQSQYSNAIQLLFTQGKPACCVPHGRPVDRPSECVHQRLGAVASAVCDHRLHLALPLLVRLPQLGPVRRQRALRHAIYLETEAAAAVVLQHGPAG